MLVDEPKGVHHLVVGDQGVIEACTEKEDCVYVTTSLDHHFYSHN